jgi:hypothetical protein
LWDVEAPTLPRHSAHRWRKVVSPLPLSMILGIHLLEAESTCAAERITATETGVFESAATSFSLIAPDGTGTTKSADATCN